MAMYLLFEDGSELTVHTGEKLRLSSKDIYQLATIQVDGNELAWVKHMFPDFAFANSRIDHFFGDEAKRIAMQLPNL